MPPITRRDFLKLGSLISGALAASGLAPQLRGPVSLGPSGNIIVLVFDAMSAKNLSLYGYHRRTTPNLERFAQRSTVYNQHYSAGNFTTPGTASLLTGLYPWTHRAINERGLIERQQAVHNLFAALGPRYHRLAWSQNTLPNYLFSQFRRDIDELLSPARFSVMGHIAADAFGADTADSHRAFDDLLFQDDNPPGSLLFGLIERLQIRRSVINAAKNGRGLITRTTNYPIYFRLNEVFDGLIQTVGALSSPSLAYLHLWTPHAPYQPSKGFAGQFADGWTPPRKTRNRFSDSSLQYGDETIDHDRQLYDEYIADLDNEFGRLLDFMDANGILERSTVIVTSDHGELFERGIEGHVHRLLYEPVVRVPLLISSPGQQARRDVNVPTSAVDLLPTLAHLSGAAAPAWAEGQVLPAFGGVEEAERSLFMVEAKHNAAFAPLTKVSVGLRKGRYKLTYYLGFQTRVKKQTPHWELYDIENDPEELTDLYAEGSGVSKELSEELLAKLDTANGQYKGQP
jgi:arylsulfatase A-like enzyme